MKKDPWLYSALIIAGTMHLLFLTGLVQHVNADLYEVFLGETILLGLGIPAMAANALAYAYRHPFMIIVSSGAYGLICLVPKPGFQFFLIPALLCLIDFIKVILKEQSSGNGHQFQR